MKQNFFSGVPTAAISYYYLLESREKISRANVCKLLIVAPAFKSTSFICRPARWYRALDSLLRKLHNLWPCYSRCYSTRKLPQRDLFYLTSDVDCRRGCHSLSDYSYVSTRFQRWCSVSVLRYIYTIFNL